MLLKKALSDLLLGCHHSSSLPFLSCSKTGGKTYVSKLKKNRKIIVSEAENFPSDLYILEGVKKIFGKSYKIQLIKEGDYKIENHINFSTAVVVLSHINYKTGRINDIKKITRVS